ncbi:hypothetical protein STXM2123_3187 [Streptomyces sp. F-3]|nr:hypothetical protein STXM2123_3187 [Streptomyces sp. F-3]
MRRPVPQDRATVANPSGPQALWWLQSDVFHGKLNLRFTE